MGAAMIGTTVPASFRATFVKARSALCHDDIATARPLFEQMAAALPANVEVRLYAAWARARAAESRSDRDREDLVDVAAALDAPVREAGSLGVGVGAIRRLAFEVDFDVCLGEGTHIEARIFDRTATKGLEIGVYGRAFPGEPVSGDGAAWRRVEGSLVATG
jgi:hypothetical protein